MTAPSVGDPAPHVDLLDLDGQTVSLDRWRGNSLLLVFLRDPG